MIRETGPPSPEKIHFIDCGSARPCLRFLPSREGGTVKQEFHVDDVVQRIDSIAETEMNELPIGMIQLDREGRILKFNRAEGDLARRDPKQQIGKSFFDEVAPCTKVREFHGRFVEGVAKRELNATFAYTFLFPFGKQDVVITLFYSQQTDTVWVLVSRKSSVPATTPAARAR